MTIFDEFWQHYPRKIGTGAARKAFGRLSLADQAKAAQVIPLQARAWKGTAKQFIPHATTWLNQGRYDDEFEVPEADKWMAALYGHETGGHQAIRPDAGYLDAGSGSGKVARRTITNGFRSLADAATDVRRRDDTGSDSGHD